MKIRNKLTLRYAAVTVAVFALFVSAIHLLTISNIITITILSIVCIVAIVLAGYVLAGKAMSPFEKMVDDVENISESNLDRRLTQEKRRDELGELAQTFNEMLDRLEKSFDSQKMFVSNISHELRTPLAAMIAEIELALMRERTNQEYQEVMNNILTDAHRMERLSKGLLDLARAGYDPSKITKENIRLDEALLDARDALIKHNKGYSINLIFDQEADDENLITVFGNEYLLKTAFINLMENNCKFSENNASIVNISFWEENSIIRFSDTGIGVSADNIGKMFDPFFRGENSTQAQGHGIGMTLVSRIIALHDGNISVRSSKGEGTVFVVSMPHV
ncbi:MAG: HAMP domain-containing sensor histidine kinase [Dysgonamonadaceae bacterium]